MKCLISNKRSISKEHFFNLVGFTLIEMLVAIAILSVIGAVSIAALRGISHSFRIISVNEDELRNLRWFFETIDVELSSAVFFRSSRFTMFESKRKDIGGIEVSDLRFTFIMPQGYLELGSRGEIVVVEYRVEQEKDKEGFVLIKSTQFNPYSPSENSKEVFVLLTNVRGFDLRFMDGGKWKDNWDSEISRDIPDVVELRLQIGTKKYVQYYKIFPSVL